MALSLKKIGGELLKPGGAGRIPSMITTEIGASIGRKIRGDNQTSSNQTFQPVQSKPIQTYNSRYPGFDEEDYNRLLQIADSTGKTGSEKAQFMDEAYQYYYPQVLNKQKLDERQETINNWVYENGEKLANGDKLTNAQYRLLNLTQMAKEKFDIAYNVEDSQIIHNIVEKTPNGQELLTKFLDTGDTEILYATGIYDKGQEAQDFRSQKDIANEVLGGNFWKNAWNNMYANSFAPLDSAEKFLYKGIKNMQMLGTKIDDYFADKNLPEGLRKDAFGDKTAEQIRAENQQFRDTAKREIDDYIGLVNDANQRNRANTVNPIVDNYYQRRNFTDLLAEGDIDGFFYKGFGDAASNRDMPVIIGASIINPAMGTALMGTNSYVRESEEAYETMRRAGATHEQAEAGGAVVGLVNSAIEVYLDKLLGGVETSTTKGAREAIRQNVMKEVVNKPFEEIVSSATKTYVGSSLEEGLEEWLQNIVTNAAEMTVKENPEWKDLFEGGRAAAEGGIFNPFNILAPAGDVARNTDVNTVKQSMMDGAYNAGVMARNITDMFKGVPVKSKNVWQKVIETPTRSIPEKIVENELKLTPTERKNVEKNGITPANFVLNEKIAGLSNADKVIALQDISSDAYNNVTNTFKNVIPQDYRTESKTAGKMLQTMIDTMEKSDIVKEEYADYIAKLKEMKGYQTFSPFEKLAIRRDFDAIVGNDIFGANGRVKGLEDKTIAKWRADLNEEINQIGEEFGIDVKSENSRIANAITIRDGLLRSLSQNKKNNAIGLQDLGIGAILSAGNPVQAGGVIAAKRLLENAAGNIAQGIYNMNDAPLERANTKRGAGFIKKSNPNANNNFMISSASSDIATNPQEELITEDIDLGANPTDLTATEEVMEEEVTTLPKKEKTIIKDSNGDEVVVYHGSNYKGFDKQHISRGGGFRFTTEEGEAGSYGKYVKPYKLKASNILDMDAPNFKELSDKIIKQYTKEKFGREFYISPEAFIQDEGLRDYMQELGYDALKFTKGDLTRYIVYDENQILPYKEAKKKTSKKQTENKVKLDTKKIASDYMKGDMDWNKYQHLAGLTEEQALEKRGKFETAIDEEWDKNQDYYNTHQSELVEKFHHLLDTSKKGLDKNQASSKTAAVENTTVETEDGEVVSETEIETLPADVSIEKEAKQVGEKRIAPDRVPRQQLTFDEGVKKLQDQVKAVADYIQLKTDYYNDMYGEYKGDKDSGQIMVDYSKAKKDIQNILWKDWQFKSNKSKEFVELRNNIKDNIGNEKGLEEIGKTFYISKVKKDISKGYQFPIAVLEKIPGVQKALNARERYQKGIDTSFSAKDARIDYSEQDKIGGGIKSQDGKQVTKEQKDNIVKGILDFQDVFGINVKKLAKDKGIVFVDLHGGNAFLSQASGMYRESWKEEGGPKNVSVSVGGSETIRWKDKQTKEWKTEKVNTTMSHELGHAMDYLVDKKLLDRSDYLDLYQKYKKPERRLGGFADYLKRPTEVTARAFEEYMDVAKGGDNYYDKVGYWNKDDFEYIVKPILEEAIEKKLSEWRLKKS